ncbi:hypothetical protein N566_01850 [Streptomycetaceae bacterium MP113-05]|nr:hypothetical protein N566_01850 [Streptomycetaceae bacterium MP113-05]
MSRTKKLIAVSTLSLGLLAAATGPALAHRHASAEPAGPPPSAAGPLDSRHTGVLPEGNRHGS